MKAVLILLLMCGTVALATNEPPAPAMELEEGVNLDEVRFVEPVPFDTIAWALAILVGVPAIIVAYCRAWTARRKGKPIDTHRRVILLASIIIASTGVLMVVLKTASSLWFISTTSFTGAAARAMLFLNVAWAFRLFAVSLIAATVGLVGVLLLPVERKGKQSPQQPPA
jgi:ACR3 family arsenite efflux pump ArsB